MKQLFQADQSVDGSAGTGRGAALLILMVPGLVLAAWNSHNHDDATCSHRTADGYAAHQSEAALNRSEEIRSTVDPNTAPWWELTILPGIGETKNAISLRFERPDGPQIPLSTRSASDHLLIWIKFSELGPRRLTGWPLN